MRLIGDLLGEVLANTAKLVAERKALIREGSCAPGVGGTVSAVQKNAGGKGGPGFKSSANAFTADHSLPAQRVTGPKSTEGGKRW